MKNIFALGVLMMSVHISYTQVAIPNTLKKPTTQKIDLSEVKGTIYEHEEFAKGVLIDELGHQEKPYYIRYNAYNDEVELVDKISSKNVSAMLSKSEGIYAKIGTKEYRRINYKTSKGDQINRISIKLADNQHLALHKFIEKEFVPERKAKTSLEKDVPAKFRTSTTYYILKEDLLYEIDLNKKSIIKVLPEHKKALEAFMDSEKLNLKKEEDVIALISNL